MISAGFSFFFQFFGTDLKTRISSRNYQQIWFSGVFSRKFDSELKPQYDRQTVRIYVTLENREFDSGGSSSQCSHSAPSNTSQHGKWRKTASVYAQMRMIDPFLLANFAVALGLVRGIEFDWLARSRSMTFRNVFGKFSFFVFFWNFRSFYSVFSFFSVFHYFSVFFTIFNPSFRKRQQFEE